MTPTVMQLAEELDGQKQALVALADAPMLEPISNDLAVVDDVTYTRVGEIAKAVKAAIKTVQVRWADIKKGASDHHRKICAQENAELAPLLAAQTTCVNNMNKFLQLQEADRRRKEREAAEVAEAERRRLATEAAAQQAEQDRIAREAAAALKKGDMRAAAELSQKAEQAAEQVQATKEEAAAVMEMPVVSSAPKVAGITPRKKWKLVPKGTVDGKPTLAQSQAAVLRLAQAIVEGAFPLMVLTPVRGGPDELQPVLEPNMAALNNMAMRQQASTNVPGYEAIEDTSLAVSAR